jgi:hypothetical protein
MQILQQTPCSFDIFTDLFKNIQVLFDKTATAVAQWLRYCATNRKVAGSIPGGVIGFFR